MKTMTVSKLLAVLETQPKPGRGKLQTALRTLGVAEPPGWDQDGKGAKELRVLFVRPALFLRARRTMLTSTTSRPTPSASQILLNPPRPL